jgi:uncharacterized protein (DUF2141 family)
MSNIPLLSGTKAFDDMSAEEFKAHVCSLYWKPAPKASAKKETLPFVVRRNKKGTLCIRVNRRPKWLTRDEVDGIAKSTKTPANEVWIKVKKAKIEIVANATKEKKC